MHKLFKTKYYFISKFDSNSITKQDNKTVIIYRNYSKNPIDQNLIITIRDFCKKLKKKFYVSNNVKLAIKLNLDGAYIPSFNRHFSHLSYSLKKDFELIGSAHNLKEIKLKETQKIKKIVISSIFKNNKNYLGINKFKNISKYTNKEIIALGGITKKNIKKLKLINSDSFAGISFFE